MSIPVIVQNDTINLPVHVPDGTRLEITLLEPQVRPGENPLAWMEEFVGCIKDLPEDFAAQHDHYIHGNPKQSA
jgi:hypothetical protein